MRVALSLFIGLGCVVLHTAFLVRLLGPYPLYDLLLPLIVRVSIFGPKGESILIILVLGTIMDALSGSPAGLYVVSYLWVFAGVRGSMYFLDAGSLFLFPLILAVGIILQNMLFAISIHGFIFESHQFFFLLKTIILQVTVGLVTAPFFLLILNAAYARCDRWRVQLRGEQPDPEH